MDEFEKAIDEIKDDVPLVKRLRSIPLDKWELTDLEQECAARKALTDEWIRMYSGQRWVGDVLKDLRAQFPGSPVGDLIAGLPELEQAMVRNILLPPSVKYMDLPIRELGRELWHSSVEQAIVAASAKSNYSADKILALATIPDHVMPAARKYAEALFQAALGRRIEP